MLYLAVEGWQGLDVSTLELAQGGVRYTIDTLRALRGGTPPLAPIFLCGSDALADVASWRDHETLLAEFDFVTVVRPDDAGGHRTVGWPDSVARRVAPLPSTGGGAAPGTGGRVFGLDMPALAISSSLVRGRLASGRPVDDLVPTRVARYIQRHRLYMEEVPR
jgi:nicotinate-nucleotide adenylyltransferase